MRKITISMIAGMLFASTASDGLVIDDYSTQIGGTGLDISVAGAGTSTSATDSGIALAGTSGDRTATLTLSNVLPQLPFGDIDLQTISLLNPVLVDGNYNLEPGNFLNSNSGLGTNGFMIELSYDFSGIDLSLFGDRFEFEFGSGDFDIDQRNPPVFVPYDITVTSGSGSDTAGVMVSDEGIYSIDFAAYSGVDFSDVTNITMNFGGQVQTPDFLVGPVSVVPEPGTVALLVAGGLMLIRRR